MDVIIIFVAMLMIYLYFMAVYFVRHSNERQKKKSNFMIRAISYFRRENFDQAQYYFELAYNESVKLEDNHLAAESLYYLTLIHNKQGNNQKAAKLIKDSITINT